MLDIRARLEDAKLLWANGRREGAFLVALIAVAATARRRYPRLGDRESFEKFLVDSHAVRINIEFRGAIHPIEHILYKWFRCALVHEGKLPIDIELIAETEPGMSVRAGGAPDYLFKLGEGWFQHLIASVLRTVEHERFNSGIDQRPEEQPSGPRPPTAR
jgi:hypothetical protein